MVLHMRHICIDGIVQIYLGVYYALSHFQTLATFIRVPVCVVCVSHNSHIMLRHVCASAFASTCAGEQDPPHPPPTQPRARNAALYSITGAQIRSPLSPHASCEWMRKSARAYCYDMGAHMCAGKHV